MRREANIQEKNIENTKRTRKIYKKKKFKKKLTINAINRQIWGSDSLCADEQKNAAAI